MKNDGEIDFVIIWVDGSDPEWQAEKAKYAPPVHTDSRPERYRDWELLPYWFRGVERFAPWVRKIHFVTWGHIPGWLNTSHPKLNIVRHEDYIPEKYLPTFSANPIELNLHRIKGLSENFVYFNDDMFLISPVSREVFFKNGLPCDSAVLNVHCYSPEVSFHMCPIRDIGIINKYFSMKEVIKKDPAKWFCPLYGRQLLRTLALLPCPRFPGMWQHHLPTSFRRQTFEELWELEGAELDDTCMKKFRHMLDYNQWLFKEWQLAKGEFVPRSTRIGANMRLGDMNECSEVCEYIRKRKGKMICINDGRLTDEEFERYKKELISAFDAILPHKSEFEVDG
ncbi:MAG: Stealth CR1 domain-containing protein [Huintestinicola sp.]|uniref:Stealth CR1 domain-containing protein n=1 Tax=Huintestinicola sp. TaxID=2981661 RepID=UPI003F0ACE79